MRSLGRRRFGGLNETTGEADKTRSKRPKDVPLAQKVKKVYVFINTILHLVALALHVLVHVGDTALPAVVAIVVLCHEGSDSCNWGVLPEPLDLAVTLDTVVL